MKKGFLKNISVMDSPSSSTPTQKKSRKTLWMILLAVILIVIIAVGAFIAMGGLGTNNSAATPTPTPGGNPTPTTGTSSTPTPSVTGADIAGASSLQYSVEATSGGVSQGSYTYYGKNAGTDNFMMRIDYTDGSGDQGSFIINSAQQKAWSYSDGEWTDVSIAFSMQYDTWNTLWEGYVNALGAWTGLGDYTYSAGGDSVRIYGVSVNPSLPDSLFTPS